MSGFLKSIFASCLFLLAAMSQLAMASTEAPLTLQSFDIEEPALDENITLDHHDSDGYRVCKIKVIINIEQLFQTEHLAKKACSDIHQVFERGCQVRYLGYGRGWGVFFSNEWVFMGKGDSWKQGKRGAFEKYSEFANRFGWGKRFPHRLHFSSCSG
jgi:hypothetical protein